MTAAQIKTIINLIRTGWRPYNAEVTSAAYESIQCPHAQSKGKTKPFWFVRGDIYLCLGCPKNCTLNRPAGFLLPLPIRYSECPEEPYQLSPAEMIVRKSLLRVDEVAYCLNISERTVYDWISDGRLRKTAEAPVRIPVEDVAFRMTNFAD